MKAQTAGRRSGRTAKHQQTVAPSRKRRRQRAPALPAVASGRLAAGGGRTTAGPNALSASMTAGAMPTAVSARSLAPVTRKAVAAASQMADGLAALAMAARRWRPRTVPVEPPPAWAATAARAALTSVVVADSTPEASAPGRPRHSGQDPRDASPSVAPQSPAAPSRGSSRAVAVGAAPTSRPARPASAHSIKGGPPKAPRHRPRLPDAPVVGAAIEPVVAAIAVEANAGPAAHAVDAVPMGIETEIEPATPIAVDRPMESAQALAAVPIGIVGAAGLDSDRTLPAHKPQLSVLVQSPAVERVRSTRAQEIGDEGERLAAIRLEELGWRILARNLRVNRVEVDILAIDPSEPASLVLVEVRRRNRRDFGLAEETVDYRKRFALRRAAGELAIRPVLGDGRRLPELPVRVDLIAIDRGPDGRPSLRHHRGIDV